MAERRHWLRPGVFIVNFEHISHIFLVFLLLTWNRPIFTESNRNTRKSCQMYSKLPIYTREKNQMTYLWGFYSYLIQIQCLKFICNLNNFEVSRIFTESKYTKNKKQLKRTLFRHNISKIISISYVPFLNL